MNPITIASTFSIQKISKHHFLIRGDERVGDYMKFCDVKWSNTYKGWLVHENDEVDLIQMHMEILDSIKNEQNEKKVSKKSKSKKNKKEESPKNKKSSSPKNDKKKKSSKKLSDYEKIKRNIDITDDEDDEEYIPSSSYGSEDTDDSEYEPNDSNENSDESEEDSEYTDTESECDDESDCDESSEEADSGDEKVEKKEFQFYKKGILAFGKMNKKEKTKFEPIWNKHLGGWIIRKSYQEKLEKYGWKEIPDQVEEKKAPPKINILIPRSKNSKTNTPSTVPSTPVVASTPVASVPTVYKERTFDFYKNVLHVSGPMKDTEETALDAIFNPLINGYIVTKNYLSKLVELGFTERNQENNNAESKEPQVIKIQFNETQKLDLQNEKTVA